MKKMILAAVLLVGLTSKADSIVFEAKNAGQPIKVELVSHDSNSVAAVGYDKDGNKRIMVGLGTSYYAPFYQYNTSSKIAENEVEISAAEAARLIAYVAKASNECPVEIQVDRNNFKIVKVIAACDPLADVQSSSKLDDAI